MSMRVISWEEYIGSRETCPLAVTVGVFDGVHLGHQSLIRRICEPSAPQSLFPVPCSLFPLPTVVTFRENPIKSLNPALFTGDIYSLEQKLGLLEALGVKLTVLIDFSDEFSKIDGRDFIDLLLGRQSVTMLALGENFRCGQGRNTGVEEIRNFARAREVETWVAPPVMDGGKPVSSNRIRQALADRRFEEAQRMLGRPLNSIPFNTFVPK
jgi:riboflavin kinase / FMN adenylyltransferase